MWNCGSKDEYLHNIGLHNAYKNCDLKMVKLLLLNGAKKEKYNLYCDIPEELASECEDPKKQEDKAAIIELLKD